MSVFSAAVCRGDTPHVWGVRPRHGMQNMTLRAGGYDCPIRCPSQRQSTQHVQREGAYIKGCRWCAFRNKLLSMSIALTSDSAFIVSEAGNVWAWGTKYMAYVKRTPADALPVRITTVGGEFERTAIRCVAASRSISDVDTLEPKPRETMAALGKDGSLWTWGHNSHGQLGHGSINSRDDTPRNEPTRVDLGVRELAHYRYLGFPVYFCQVVCGDYHIIARSSVGIYQVWVCGHNGCGQLGVVDASQPSSHQMRPVPDFRGKNIRQVAAYRNRSAAVTMDGKVYTWGRSESTYAIGHSRVGAFERPTFVWPRFDDLARVGDPPRDQRETFFDACVMNDHCTLMVSMGQRGMSFLITTRIGLERSNGPEPYAVGTDDPKRVLLCCGSDVRHDAGETMYTWEFEKRDFGGSQMRAIASGEIHTLVLTNEGSVWLVGSRYTSYTQNNHPLHTPCPGLWWRQGRVPVDPPAPGPLHAHSTEHEIHVYQNRRFHKDPTAGWKTPMRAMFGLGRSPHFVRIATGGELSAAVADDGTMYAWGNVIDKPLPHDVRAPICLPPALFGHQRVGHWERLADDRRLALGMSMHPRLALRPDPTIARIREYTMSLFYRIMQRRAPAPPRPQHGLQHMTSELMGVIAEYAAPRVKPGNVMVSRDGCKNPPYTG